MATAHPSPWLQSVMTGVSAPMGPDLTDRVARCDCGAERPSRDRAALFGFEDCGPGSHQATERCVCGFDRVAHAPEGLARLIRQGRCLGFVARGPSQYDRFYCGCRGMD